MSTANPTRLRIGVAGMIDGRRLTVAGRAVLSTEVEGETYYWNEFNVTDAAGAGSVLVYEDDAAGPEWKLFRKFEPERALTAAEAARVKQGDLVNLDVTPARVTLVSQSRVEHVEGDPAESIVDGDTADYFNADCTSGARLLVASWTGEDIEFFWGENLQMDVRPDGSFSGSRKARSCFNNHAQSASPSLVGKVIIAVAMAAFLSFFIFGLWESGQPATSAPPPKQAAPALRLTTGARGPLAGDTYTVASHALVEVADAAGKFERHEYDLVGPGGQRAWLIQGLGAGAHEWHLLSPDDPPQGFTPLVAAARKPGQMLAVAGRTFNVSGLFLCQTLARDGADDPVAAPGIVRYGFIAQGGGDVLLARWTESDLQLLLGHPLTEAAVLAAFAAGPEAAK